MIAVDTSALIAIVLNEPKATDLLAVLSKTDTILISAPTLTETYIVAGQKNVSDRLVELLQIIRLEVVPLDERGAGLAADTYI